MNYRAVRHKLNVNRSTKEKKKKEFTYFPEAKVESSEVTFTVHEGAIQTQKSSSMRGFMQQSLIKRHSYEAESPRNLWSL